MAGVESDDGIERKHYHVSYYDTVAANLFRFSHMQKKYQNTSQFDKVIAKKKGAYFAAECSCDSRSHMSCNGTSLIFVI